MKPPKINAEAAAREAISQYDADGNGLIDGDELKQFPALKAALKRIDANSDGGVSADELAARIKSWRDSRIGRTALNCWIFYKGCPVEGATVTFEPEKFLGDRIQQAVGMTNRRGRAMLGIPGADSPGAAYGLYRVRISKKEGAKETLPAKFNISSILGQEIAQDTPGMQEGLVFNLQE